MLYISLYLTNHHHIFFTLTPYSYLKENSFDIQYDEIFSSLHAKQSTNSSYTAPPPASFTSMPTHNIDVDASLFKAAYMECSTFSSMTAVSAEDEQASKDYITQLRPYLFEMTSILEDPVTGQALPYSFRKEITSSATTSSGNTTTSSSTNQHPLTSSSTIFNYATNTNSTIASFTTYTAAAAAEDSSLPPPLPFKSVTTAAGSTSNHTRTMKIMNEIKTFTESLPLDYRSSVFVKCEEARCDVLKALITGTHKCIMYPLIFSLNFSLYLLLSIPPFYSLIFLYFPLYFRLNFPLFPLFYIIGPIGTPYENGCFEFDLYLPPDYPNVPPQVRFCTTGNGAVRFNPNLYNCGKVSVVAL